MTDPLPPLPIQATGCDSQDTGLHQLLGAFISDEIAQLLAHLSARFRPQTGESTTDPATSLAQTALNAAHGGHTNDPAIQLACLLLAVVEADAAGEHHLVADALEELATLQRAAGSPTYAHAAAAVAARERALASAGLN